VSDPVIKRLVLFIITRDSNLCRKSITSREEMNTITDTVCVCVCVCVRECPCSERWLVVYREHMATVTTTCHRPQDLILHSSSYIILQEKNNISPHAISFHYCHKTEISAANQLSTLHSKKCWAAANQLSTLHSKKCWVEMASMASPLMLC